MTSQQSVGNNSVGAVASRTKTSFLNTEVCFNEFDFHVPDPDGITSENNRLRPLLSYSSESETGESCYLGVSFSSGLDGLKMAAMRDKIHLRLSIVLDISGSMGSAFEVASHAHA